MIAYVALLRAVNVGGTGKLAMADLTRVGQACGFDDVRTYIASGNLLFRSGADEREVKTALEARLAETLGTRTAVLVRTGEEMAEVAAHNPFPDAPGNRVVAIFLDQPPPADSPAHARNLAGERIVLGKREIYVSYPDGMANSRLVIPAATSGTARNLNTVRKLAELALTATPSN